jgi:hypothetical protein
LSIVEGAAGAHSPRSFLLITKCTSITLIKSSGIFEDRRLLAWFVNHTERFEKARAILSRINEDPDRGVHDELLWAVALFAGIVCLTFGLVFLIISIVGGR